MTVAAESDQQRNVHIAGERAPGAGERAPGATVEGAQHRLTVDLGSGFAWEALQATCAELGVSPEELLKFSLSYYLADFDSGRIARQMPVGAPHLRGLSSKPGA